MRFKQLLFIVQKKTTLLELLVVQRFMVMQERRQK